jgi:hypothetical protein
MKFLRLGKALIENICTKLITGIHGDDHIQLYGELCEVIEEVIQDFQVQGRDLPIPRIRPMQEVA